MRQRGRAVDRDSGSRQVGGRPRISRAGLHHHRTEGRMTGRVTALLKAGARLLALAVLFTLFNPAGALAHAVLQATSPAADSVSAKAPDSIGLIFNEPVQLLALRIIDATGRDRSPPSAPEVRDGRVLW